MSQKISRQALPDWVGKEIGVSDWFEIDQERINNFAEVTNDHQFIHVDEERAKDTPFGGTIAHGFLTLSLMPMLAQQTSLEVEGTVMALNYGCNKLRFMAPVRTGKRIRLRSTLKDVRDRGAGRHLLTTGLVFEIEGEDKPALVADWLTLIIVQ